ncbi:hypothetical protein Taro_025800 [Colocasia esculenta]|uniref:Uncharacterized protein n=1 Tax=Colocasia esculenta TaxID=4460 RepID=A0A843V9T5_COLES|nr:hypothetical protein [Colocasia esculenta]
MDTIPFRHVQWTPYVGEDDATQPWVERGRPYFGRDIWLHCFNTVVPLHHRLVARTLGLHQAVVEFPTRQSFRGIQQVTDWIVRVREQLDDWERRGKEVVSEAASDEDYYRAYARRYGAQVYRGTRRPDWRRTWCPRREWLLMKEQEGKPQPRGAPDQQSAGPWRAERIAGGSSGVRRLCAAVRSWGVSWISKGGEDGTRLGRRESRRDGWMARQAPFQSSSMVFPSS